MGAGGGGWSECSRMHIFSLIHERRTRARRKEGGENVRRERKKRLCPLLFSA